MEVDQVLAKLNSDFKAFSARNFKSTPAMRDDTFRARNELFRQWNARAKWWT
jgi:hypothetical protein